MSDGRRSPAPADSPLAADTRRLKHAMRGGAMTAGVAQTASQLISLAVLACLYRLLVPDDFGLIGMVLPVLLLVRNLSTMGLYVGAIQRENISHAELSTLFWLNLALGALAAGVITALAPLLAGFYGGRPEVALLAAALAGTSLVASAGAQHQALLERRMRWAPLAAARLIGQAAAGATAVAAALAGWGIWALVVQQYTELLVLSVLFWRLEGWRPLRPFRGAPVGGLLAFGGYFSAANLMSFLTTNVDKVLVGYALGPRALGLYSQSFNLMMKPGYLLTTPLAAIMLPALSRARGQAETYRQLLAGCWRLIAVVLFPIAAGLWVVAPEVMHVLGGARWSGAGVILAALAPALLVQGYTNVAAILCASAGRTARLLAGAATFAAAMCAVIGIAIWFIGWRQLTTDEGVVLVAWSYSLGSIALATAYLVYCLRTVDVPLRTCGATIVRPALAALVMALAVWGCRGVLSASGQWPSWAVLGVLVPVGAAVYMVLAFPDVRWLYQQFVLLRRPKDSHTSTR